ncbi:hypothetical protein [Streptomyces coeruleorubidus]|uniref:hypothetical protein n=1 Tax=Streptomyces coeruleorubidus TaxID=116188 RepID=UPI0033FB0B65
MNRRSLPVAAVTVMAAASLLLAGCGSGGEGSKNDKIAGADTGDEETSSTPPAPSASTGDGIDRPEMPFPKDVKLDFEAPGTSDPLQAAAANDAFNFVRAIRYGIVKQDPDNAAYKFYSEVQSPAQAYAKEQIQQRVDRKLTIAGTMRFYETKVQLTKNEESATVSFCSDTSSYYSKEVETGRVHRTEGTARDYGHWQVVMRSSEHTKGLWRADLIEVRENVRECQR